MDYRNEILSALIATVIAIITGWITARQTYKGEIKKSVYEEREKLYVDLFNILDNLQRHPDILYDSLNFVTEYKLIWAKVNLYASEDVLHIMQSFNVKLNEYWNRYNTIYSDEQIEREIEKRLYEDEQEGKCTQRSEIEFLINQEEEYFLRNNQINPADIQKIMETLSYQIRKELMTK